MLKKVLVMPDSFKGSLSSLEICSLMEEAIHSKYPQCQVRSIPIADGGEGSVDSFLTAMGGRKVELTAMDPLFRPISTTYGVLRDEKTAVIEMAACAGLPLVANEKDPCKTTTYGVGEQIAHALRSGIRKIIVGLGGSSTNDGGAGAMAALGAKFYKENGESFVPTGGTLREIHSIDRSGMLPEIAESEIITMCDIDNPMYGPTGAAYVFGPQKGADPEMVEELDAGLRHYSEKIKECLGRDVSQIPGSGAAGAMGAGMVAFLDSKLEMGIQVILNVIGFESLAADADFIFSGEGHLDSQSLRGKVVVGIAQRAKPLGVPVIPVVGGVAPGLGDLSHLGIPAVFTTNRRPQSLADAMAGGRESMRDTLRDLINFAAVIDSLKKKEC